MRPLEDIDTGYSGRYCSTFFCDYRQERYCCRDCYRYNKCTNPCLNDPSRCQLEDKEPTKHRRPLYKMR